MKNTLPIIAFFIFSLCLGIFLSDIDTLKDCATKGEAHLVGGGMIECSVKKGQQ